jgi:chorismate mutase
MLRGLDSWHTDTIMNFTSGAGPTELLSLDNIREQLIRLEDTIIFCAYLVNCP